MYVSSRLVNIGKIEEVNRMHILLALLSKYFLKKKIYDKSRAAEKVVMGAAFIVAGGAAACGSLE